MRAENLTGTVLTLACGFGLGATVMYYFDPERGRHRRAMCMQQLTSAANDVKDTLGSTARDLGNRARGVLAEAKSAITTGQTPEREADGGERAAA